LCVKLSVAQTEGDTGYDYNDAYEDEFYDESGAERKMFSSNIYNIKCLCSNVAVKLRSLCYIILRNGAGGLVESSHVTRNINE